jgi:hypothetical protein
VVRVSLKWRILLSVVVLAALGIGVWLKLNGPKLERQWRVYLVGAAPSYEDACRQLAWFEGPTDQDVKRRELIRKWGAGNAQFDLYLARYVDDPACPEALREAFSLNLAWREGLLSRWAHYWSWRPGLSPDERIQSLLPFLDLLGDSESKTLSWREVLNLQAVFCLTGQPRLALRLDPDNWRDRYRRWQAARPASLPRVVRPHEPFPKP